MTGRYCGECGQREIEAHEWTLRHFFGHVLHELTHLDANKILRTVGALLFRPGELSEAYLAGRRLRYIGPIRVYLVCSAIFFFAAWSATLTAYGYRSHPRLSAGITAQAELRQIPIELYREHFHHALDQYAGILWFFGVLVIGCFLLLLFRRTRLHYVQHLIVALHVQSFEFVMRMATVALFHLAEPTGLTWLYWSLWAGYLVQFTYVVFALRRVYRQSVGLTLLKATLLVVLSFVVIFLVLTGATTLAFRFT